MVRTKLFQMMPKPWYKNITTAGELAEYSDLFPETIDKKSQSVQISPDIFFFKRLEQMGFKVMAHGGVLPIHWDVKTNKAYWLPANTPPTRDVVINGKPFGWVPELVAA